MRTALTLGMIGLATTAAAQDADSQAGEDLFQSYCAQCHGPDASGDGPMAEMMAIEVPDLTGLSARNGGTFPVEAAAMRIDGRAPVLAHGGDMPIFGRFLESDQAVAIPLPSGQVLMAGQPLADILAYLETVQN